MTGAPRTGVVVLDFGRPADAARAAASVHAARAATSLGGEPRVLVVENGSPGPSDPGHLRLPVNLGFGGGMNAGLARLAAEGCDPILLLNSDAELEPGSLDRLRTALAGEALGAVGPVILREPDGRVESRGVSVDRRFGRVRLVGHAERPPTGAGIAPVAALSGAVMMLSRQALERVGPLDEEYFFSFEDIDWCVRAAAVGFGLAVVLDARARHGGSRTIGRASADRLYYAARNHARFLARHGAAPARRLAPDTAAGWNLAHALVQRECPRLLAVRAVLDGLRDARRGRFGPRTTTPGSEPGRGAATIPGE